MASASGQSCSAIEAEILANPSSFSFSRLLTHLQTIVKLNGEEPSKKINIRPALSMQISRSEIVAVTKNELGEWDVVTNFLGLYGASSPLPNFYTQELIALEQEEQTTARRFLDVIHQRLYQLYAQAQQKYNAIGQVVEYQQKGFTQLLHNILGSGDAALQAQFLEPDQLLNFVGLLSAKQRSASGLKALLEAFLVGIDVKVEQFVARTVTLPEMHLSRLGVSSCQLGNNALIGDRITDNQAKIAIHIGPLNQQEFDSLVNNKSQWKILIGLVKSYINSPLEVDIHIGLVSQAAQEISLGENKWCQLGYDTWLLDKASGAKSTDVLVTTLQLT